MNSKEEKRRRNKENEREYCGFKKCDNNIITKMKEWFKYDEQQRRKGKERQIQ